MAGYRDEQGSILGCTNKFALREAERKNEPTVGTLTHWGKAELSNSGVSGEGSEERTEYSPLLYHKRRAAKVKGEE